MSVLDHLNGALNYMIQIGPEIEAGIAKQNTDEEKEVELWLPIVKVR